MAVGPGGGGLAASLAALWPLEDRLGFGVTAFADDIGTRLGRLRDPNDGSDLGTTPALHRFAYGIAWRLDARSAVRRGWEPFVSGTWGYYRIQDDRLGSTFDAVSAAGFSLGAGVRRPMRGDSRLGASLRYHRLSSDRVGRYLTASMDWSWRPAR